MIGIRPEARATSADGLLDLEVVLVEALGSDLLVHLRTDAPRVTISDAFDGEEDAGLEARFTARLPPDLRVEVGDRLRLGVDLGPPALLRPRVAGSPCARGRAGAAGEPERVAAATTGRPAGRCRRRTRRRTRRAP